MFVDGPDPFNLEKCIISSYALILPCIELVSASSAAFAIMDVLPVPASASNISDTSCPPVSST